jgi:pimeloyl-ACP methyl ester carboxylesterase
VGDPLRYVVANGLRFAYLEAGSGPLVLLLHGFPDTARSWDLHRSHLAAAGYRAVSPYLRGYGPSGIPRQDTTLLTLAQDVLALIEALGEQRALLVGHDWGAGAAYGAAALEPKRVSRLVTVAVPHPATFVPTPRLLWGVRHFFAYKLPGAARRFAKSDYAALPALYRRWSPDWAPAPEEFAAVRDCFADPRSLEAALGYYRALPLAAPAFLRAPISVPTVAFAGAGDRLAQPGQYQRAARFFTGGYRVETLPGGHFLHREHPDRFALRLVAALRDSSPSAPTVAPVSLGARPQH